MVRKGPNTNAIFGYLKQCGYEIDKSGITEMEQANQVLTYGKGQKADNFNDIERKISNKLAIQGYEWIY